MTGDRSEMSARENDGCRDLLSAKGIKGTKQRFAVLRVLLGSSVPLTADDIYLGLRDQGDASLSLSTVYRILDTFTHSGITAKTGLLEGGKALFEVVSGVHRHNLICVRCHKLIPLGECPLGEFEQELEATTGYRISGHKLEIYGVCPECRALPAPKTQEKTGAPERHK